MRHSKGKKVGWHKDGAVNMAIYDDFCAHDTPKLPEVWWAGFVASRSSVGM